MSKIFLGLDISKFSFDASLLLTDQTIKTKKFTNNKSDFKSLEKWLKHYNVNIEDIHACMESTGIYGDELAYFLYNINCNVSIVNPTRIKGFGMSELTRTKTDRADSQLIARFCKAISPPVWQPLKPEHKRLQQLLRRLEDLKNLLQIEKNHLEVAITNEIKNLLNLL